MRFFFPLLFSCMIAGFVLGSAALSQAQELFWAKKAGGSSTDIGYGIAVDGSGNSYVTGRFQGTSVFGPGEAGQTSISAGGLVDIFVAKYDSNGLLVWVKKAGGEGTNEGRAITVDSSGNSYVTGFFQNTATFGAGEGNQTTLVAQGGNADIFVAKYNSSGLLQWVKQAGSGNGVVGVGSSTEQGLGIGIDASNVYVTGFFQSTNVVFGPGEAGEVTLSVPGGGREIFLAKFAASNGTFAWVKNAGGVGDDEGYGIAVDSSGNSYLTGVFQQTATFDTSSVTSAANGDVFVAKYNTSGSLVWVKRAGGGSEDEGQGIAIDSSGKIYITGWLTGTNVTFGPGEGNQTVLSAGHGNDIDIFVAGYNTDGTLAWAKRAGGVTPSSGPSPDKGFGIAADADGNSYITGYFNRTATFAPSTVVAASTTAEDVFLAAYTSSGSLIWVRRDGGTAREESYAVAVRNREAHITGRFEGNASKFGAGETNETILDATAVDIFVAKYQGPVCGDSALGVGETCDEGAANGQPGSCCSSMCTLLTEGTECRAGNGECDAAEVCNGVSGTCPVDALATAGTVCRGANGTCDVVETCTGNSANCPANGFASPGTSCGGSAAACDALDTCDGSGSCVDNIDPAATVCNPGSGVCDPNDTCDGSSKTCAPVLASMGTACGGSAAACDALDTCDGSGSCVDNIDPAATVCNPGSGVCDPNDTCDGSGKTCAANFASMGTGCGGSDTACDALDTCNGSGSCIDNIDTAGTVCLTGTGTCDPNDTCDGSSKTCAPTVAGAGTACGGSDAACDALDTCNGSGSCIDNIDTAGSVCLSGTGTCDPNDTCDGSSKTCAPVFASMGTGCGGTDTACDALDTCNGSGSCTDNVDTAGTVCLTGTGTCDPNDTCDGSSKTCAPVLASMGTACGGTDAACDAFDTCNGSGSCTDNVDTAGTVCNPAGSNATCDPADTCDGSGKSCAPVLASMGTACGGTDAACDALDTCNGSGTCVDNLDSSAVICRISQSSCDPAEHCTGNSTICPMDVVAQPGQVCRPAVSLCDHEEVCDGNAQCPPDVVEPPTTICREGSGDCTDTPEFCNGTTGECPPDLPVVATFGCQIGSNPTPTWCQGGPGKDIIVGTDGPDVILGGGGNDELRGQRGDDIICGEGGNDLLVGALGNDILIGGSGNDQIRGNGSDSPLVNEEDNNREFGGEGNDTLIGGEGADRLEGESGNDRLLGHGANDLLFGGIGKDNLNAGDGDDELDGGADADKLDGGENFDKCKNGEGTLGFKNCEAVLP